MPRSPPQNLASPWDVQWTPDGTMLFTERAGPIEIKDAGTASLSTGSMLTDRGRLRTPAIAPLGSLYVTTSNESNDSILKVTPKPAS